MPSGYNRCHYTSPEGFECETFFPSDQGNLCPVHLGSLSISLASHGIGKESYLEQRNNALFSLIEAMNGKSTNDALQFLDEHIAGIERVIEGEKIKVLTARAKRAELIEGLSESERKERQKIKTPKLDSNGNVKEKRVSTAKALGADILAKEKAIASLMKAGKTREQALVIVNLD